MSLFNLLRNDEFETQRVARAVIGAFSYPGRCTAAGVVTPALALRAFAPTGSSVHWAGGPSGADGTPPVGTRPVAIDAAQVILADGSQADRALRAARRGSLLHPEEGALLILDLAAVGAAAQAGGRLLRVATSGTAPECQLWIMGLTMEFVKIWIEVNAAFPMGVDVLLVGADGTAAGLPRGATLDWAEV